MTWTLDPTLGRSATFIQNGVTYTNHYSDISSDPTWTSGSNGSWTRNVTDFNGNLAAEVTASGTTLELPDLHGDIMATASTTATGPTNTYIYTEFGTPETGTPGTYGWLGAGETSCDALGGQLLMGARAYSSETGRFSQTDPAPGGSANAYDYALQNPFTNSDPNGNWVATWHWGSEFGWIKYRFTAWETGQLIDKLHNIATGADGCDSISTGIPSPIGDILGILCDVVGVGAEAMATWFENLNNMSDDHGIYVKVWFFKITWWWFGMHHAWVPDWAWPGANN